jgi:hypothetical protein
VTEQIERSTVERIADELQETVGEPLLSVGVGWDADEVEFVYVRDDVEERFGDVLEDIGVDLLADRHLEVGNLRRHGLEGPVLDGRLYHQALIVTSWVESVPVSISLEPDTAHFRPAADALQDAILEAA